MAGECTAWASEFGVFWSSFEDVEVEEGVGVGSCTGTAGVVVGDAADGCKVARRARLVCGEREEEDCRRLVAPVGVRVSLVGSACGRRTAEDRVVSLGAVGGLWADGVAP